MNYTTDAYFEMAKYLDLWQYSELTDVVVRHTLALEIYAKKLRKINICRIASVTTVRN